jgi:K+-transporting ATPase ATPase C chain
MRLAWLPAIRLYLVLTLLTGLVYPAVVTAIAQCVWPRQANGSLVSREGVVVGSELIGQAFADSGDFWGRPSAAPGAPSGVSVSAGSNLAPANPALLAAMQTRVAMLRAADSAAAGPVPSDLVTASASGLDPHISPAAAEYQVRRVARARGLDPERVRRLVRANTELPTFGVLGEPRVNVLLLNLALAESGASR